MMTTAIEKMFKESFKKEWYETYWVFDLHGTIVKRTYKDKNAPIEYYPFADMVLRLLTQRDDIKLILWTSTFPSEIDRYLMQFEADFIHFDHVNSNPHISSRNGNFGYYDEKFYFNLLFDDKAGFDPKVEWEKIYKLMILYQKFNNLPDKNWSTKY